MKKFDIKDNGIEDDVRTPEEEVRIGRMVTCRLMRYGKLRVPFEDLMQVAMLGICRSRGCFDPTKGKWKSHAYQHGLAAASRWMTEDHGIVHIPAKVAQSGLCLHYCEVLDTDFVETIPTVSHNDGILMYDTALRVANSQSDRRKASYLAVLHDLWLGDGTTLQEVGDKLGVTRERVRKIAQDFAEKVRKQLVEDLAEKRSGYGEKDMNSIRYVAERILEVELHEKANTV